MKFHKRLGTKIQLKCHSCHLDCLPKNGDWHDGAESQIFLCRSCEYKGSQLRAKLPLRGATTASITA